MEFRSEFWNQLASYLYGHMPLNVFRQWQTGHLLDREKLSPSERDLMLAIEAGYADFLAGAPEESFKQYLCYHVSKQTTWQSVVPEPVVVKVTSTEKYPAAGLAMFQSMTSAEPSVPEWELLSA